MATGLIRAMNLFAALVVLAVTADAEDAEVETFRIPPQPWAMEWQRAPSGPGEFIPWPENGLKPTLVNGRLYLATLFGLLEENADRTWRMVPQMYQRRICPVNVMEGILWAIDGKCLVALDPTDWSVRQQVAVPEGAHVLSVEVDGFWCLEEPLTVYGDIPVTGHQVLTRYDLKGARQFRFGTRPGKAARVGQSGNQLTKKNEPVLKPDQGASPEGQIYWTAIDKDAVWLSVVDYQGIEPNDAPIFGSRKMVRVDRQTGKHAAVDTDLEPGRSVLSLPNAVLWLLPADQKNMTVHRLDKKTMEITTPAKLPVNYCGGLATDGTNLWVYAEGTQVFSLADFKPVKPDIAGRPELRFLTSRGHVPSPFFQILSNDQERVWLSAPPAVVVEVPDNGIAQTRDLSRWATSSDYIHNGKAMLGALCVYVGGTLLRVPAGAADVAARRVVKPGQSSLEMLSASDQMLWIQADYRGPVMTLTPELGEVHTIRFEQHDPAAGCRMGVAAGEFLYVARQNPGALLRVSGKTGGETPIESWRAPCGKWFAKVDGREPKGHPEHFLSQTPRMDHESGRLRFIQYVTYPRTETAPLLTIYILWNYDPKTDQWEDAVLPDDVIDQRCSNLFYNSKTAELLRFRQGKWETIARLPEAWLKAGFRDWRIAMTAKYFYARTPLGLFRATWEELKPR